MFVTIVIKERVLNLRGCGGAQKRFEWGGCDGDDIDTVLT